MEKKKTKKKWREIRSAVTMMCVMAAMLSTATYAWFTLTSSPTVTGMEMTAVSEGGLLVSPTTSDSDFKNAISIAAATNNVKQLKPVSLNKVIASGTETYGFSKPVYTGGTVTALESSIMNGTELEGYVAKYTYYLKSESGTVGVGIIAGNKNQNETLTVTNNTANASGTVVRQKADGESPASSQDASNAIRIGLVIGSADMKDMIIYEPNADAGLATGAISAAASTYTYDSTNFAIDVQSNENGTIVGSSPESKTSGKLFEVGEDEVEVTMYVWLEGTDTQCVDQIQTDILEAQIQFTSLGAVTSTN